MVTKGDILYKGQNILDITEKEKRRIRGAQIGMIFQDARGFPVSDSDHRGTRFMKACVRTEK